MLHEATTTNKTHLPSVGAMGVIRLWLIIVAALIFIMVLVGGATRLTDSGLSITEWLPILGVIPPLSEADWQAAFAKYQQIPEYERVNFGMSLTEFKFIYWWEWGHRLLGRLIGMAFLLPFLALWLTGRIPRPLMPKLVVIFILGGLQGLLGWYMVKSGLVDRVDVSQYRLAAHLGLAVLIYGYVLWVILNLGRARPETSKAGPNWQAYSALTLAGLIYGQIILGAFVAGMRAGLAHNTWPLMAGQWLPEGLLVMTPWWRNLFENALTVQFDHRILAYVICAWVVVHGWRVWRLSQSENLVRASALLLALAAYFQAVLGIWTLLAHVPIGLGLLHQAGALVLFSVAIWHVHAVLKGRHALP